MLGVKHNEADDLQQKMLQGGVSAEEQKSDEDTEENKAEDEQHKRSMQRGAQFEHGKMYNKKEWKKLPVVSMRFRITVNRTKWHFLVQQN